MPARSLALPLCAIAIAWSHVASAAPLDLERVPARAQWLMHCDMDAARESTVMKRAWKRAMKMHPQAEGMMRMATGVLGMDPVKDLRDVTAYGLDTDKGNGVLIVHGKVNRGSMEKMVEKAPDHAVKNLDAEAGLRAHDLLGRPADDVWSVVEKLADRWDHKRKEWQRAHDGKGGCPCGGGDCQGCDKCRAGECPMMNKDGAKKGGDGKADRPLRDDEF